jgi:hypothetical protein
MRRLVLVSLALLLVVTLVVGLAVARAPGGEGHAAVLLEEQLSAWNDPAVREAQRVRLRRYNPEWDFMQRTFLLLSLADAALVQPDRQDELLAVMDGLIEETLADVATFGHRYFLLPYADHASFIDPKNRSLFVDGEIALMLGARRLVRDDPRLAVLHRERNASIVEQFQASPALLPESYPNEAWLFCNTNALVALRMADALDGSDHADLVERWVTRAKSELVEESTGMLGSEFTWDGQVMDGPEGSSIWLVAINLMLLDEPFGRDQYERAHEALVDDFMGMSYAREWGPGWQGPTDIDSGPIVPILKASPSSSGFALMASRAFGDDETHQALVRSLGVADSLIRLLPHMISVADNAVGDAVLLHALTFGPLWREVKRRAGK